MFYKLYDHKSERSFGLWIPYCTALIFQWSICIPGTLLLMPFKFFFLPFHFTLPIWPKTAATTSYMHVFLYSFLYYTFVFHGRHSVSGDLLLLLSYFEWLERSDSWKKGQQVRFKMINRLVAGMLEHPAILFFFWHTVHFPSHWCFFISDRSLKRALVLMKIRYWIYLEKTQWDCAASVIWSKNWSQNFNMRILYMNIFESTE